MTNGRLRYRIFIFALLLVSLSPFATTSCSSNESKAKRVVEEYVGQGAKDITVDVFYTNSKFPDKAYASATVTYNYASGEGKAQREFLGFILAREGRAWRIESNTKYTKDQQQAAVYLAGGK